METYWIGYAIVFVLLGFGSYFMFRSGFLGFLANMIVWLFEHWYILLIIALIVLFLLTQIGVIDMSTW